MYQWLKETVNDVTLVQFGSIMVTEKLKEIFEQVNSPDSIKLMSRIQTELLEKLNNNKLQGATAQESSLNKSKADISLRFF